MIGEINSTSSGQQLKITVEWKIRNFFGLSTKMNHAYDSPTFTFMNASWYIMIYTNGQRQNDSLGCLGVYLVKKHSKTSFLRNVFFQLGIRKEDGDYVARNTEYTFPEKGGAFGWAKFLERSTLHRERSSIESEGIMTLFCSIYSSINKATQTTSQTTEAASQATHPETSSFEKLSEDLLGLLLNNDDGDVVLKVKDQEMKVHRTILKARSSVFRAMFQHGMQEASSGVVDITDCNPAVFQDFLHFMYSGQVEEFSTNKVFDLYRVADKYDVAELKVKCVEFIMANMSVGTFFDAITLALRHSEPELLERATTFFKDTISEIVVKAEWLSFLKENHVEANELYMKALKVQKS